MVCQFIDRVYSFPFLNDAVVGSVHKPPVAVYVFDEIPQNIDVPVLPGLISFYRDRIAKISEYSSISHSHILITYYIDILHSHLISFYFFSK